MDLPEVSHIGFIVNDIDKSEKRFSEIFHVEFNIYDFKPLRAWTYGEEIKDLFFRIGMGTPENGPGIEIIRPVSGKAARPLTFLETNGRNIHHLAYKVNDGDYEDWKKYFINKFAAEIVFEAEAEDKEIGYRRTFYAQMEDVEGLIEIATHPRKR